MKRFLFALSLAVLPVCATAQSSWTSYDYQSGNSYTNYADQNGVTTYGNNLNTGDNWRLRQNNDGNYNGTDADGNYFFGNQNTGAYTNLGTGTSCYGTGYARTCY